MVRLPRTAVAVLLAVLCAVPLPQAQDDDFSIGGFVADNVSAAFQGYQQMKQGVAQETQNIQAARARFWRAFTSGRDVAEAEKAFADKLWGKDVFYLMWSLPEGLDGPAALQGLSLAKLDNGIPPLAYPAFKDLVSDVRLQLGARNQRDPVIVFDPGRTLKAFVGSSERLRAYVRLRDFAEFEGSGVDLSKSIPPRTYVMRLIETQLSGWEAGRPRADPEKESLDVYSVMTRLIGEPQVLAAGARVLAAKKDGRGALSPPQMVAAELGGGPTSGTYSWFTRLLASSARGYAVIAIADAQIPAHLPFVWRATAARYDALVKAHGEAAVLKAAERVRAAPKNPASGRVGNLEPASWIATLAATPETALPAAPGKASVADYAAFKAGVKGAEITAVGTVSHVTVVSGGGALEYLDLHFKESPDGRVTARIMSTTAFEYAFGPKLAGLVGKVVEITADYWLLNDVATLRVLSRGQLVVR